MPVELVREPQAELHRNRDQCAIPHAELCSHVRASVPVAHFEVRELRVDSHHSSSPLLIEIAVKQAAADEPSLVEQLLVLRRASPGLIRVGAEHCEEALL